MTEKTIIKPTIGRVVWMYRPNIIAGFFTHARMEPYAAIVTGIQSGDDASEHYLNLAVFDDQGNIFQETGVKLIQDDSDPGHRHAKWMPYQKGQAAKTDDLTPRVVALEQALMSLTHQLNVNLSRETVQNDLGGSVRASNGSEHL